MHLKWHWYLEPEDLRISLIYDVISIQSLSRQDLYFFISAMPRSRLVVEGLQLHLLSISVCRQSFKQAWMRKKMNVRMDMLVITQINFFIETFNCRPLCEGWYVLVQCSRFQTDWKILRQYRKNHMAQKLDVSIAN